MFGAFNTFGKLGSPAGGKTLLAQILAMQPSFVGIPSVTGGYQDSAGTTALTQPGGGSADPPVGKALDLSGLGNHAIQATSTARPKLSARKNLLTKTEDFSTSWATPATFTANSAIAPDGSTTAAVSVFTSSGQLYFGGFALGPSIQSVWVRSDIPVDIDFGAYDASGFGASFERKSVTPTWTRISTANASAFSNSGDRHACMFSANYGACTLEIWHPQLELGSTATTYQRVTDASNYDYSGFPLYWKFNGVESALATGTVTAGTFGSNTDVFLAVRRNTPANVGLVYSSDDTSMLIGLAQSGSSAACVNNAGAPTVFVNGGQLAGGGGVTRDTLHAALAVGQWNILEVRNADMSLWAKVAFGNWLGGYQLDGGLGGGIIVPAQSDANRAVIRRYLAQRVGVTL